MNNILKGEFNIMSMHDCVIWAMRFDDNLYFDMDYILGVEETENSNNLLIMPITLIFYDVEDFSVRISSEWINGLEINTIQRESLRGDIYKWNLELQEGFISFKSPKYDFFSKNNPKFVEANCLTEKERGGYNFNFPSSA